MPKAADQATNNGTPPNSTACLRSTPLIDLASVPNTFQPSVEVPKSLDLIDGTLPWITARPENVPLVIPLLAGYIVGNSVDNVIVIWTVERVLFVVPLQCHCYRSHRSVGLTQVLVPSGPVSL